MRHSAPGSVCGSALDHIIATVSMPSSSTSRIEPRGDLGIAKSARLRDQRRRGLVRDKSPIQRVDVAFDLLGFLHVEHGGATESALCHLVGLARLGVVERQATPS